MSEAELIARTKTPATVDSLTGDLHRLGVLPGMNLLMHVSLASIGYVVGGAQALVLALERALGPKGTLVMPCQSADFSEPSYWQAPPVPTQWWEIIRESMPAFRVDMSMPREMSIVSLALLLQRGSRRSSHPQVSFVAHGRNAKRILGKHQLDFGLGEASPLAWMYEAGGKVLLLGVGHERNTSIHLAEYRATWPGKRNIVQGASMSSRKKIAGFPIGPERKEWRKFEEVDSRDDDFSAIGAEFERGSPEAIRAGKIGLSDAKLIDQRALVDFSVRYMAMNRRD
jgi:aminoglycoside 3-N-acetyltransferase